MKVGGQIPAGVNRLFFRKKMKTECRVINCKNQKFKKGYCEKHYIKIIERNPEFLKNKKHHGMSKTIEYRTWMAMKSRCYSENHKEYKNYGGRGIKICESWINDFASFYRDMGPKPTQKHSIDRIDNNKGYSKENCRWANAFQQATNKRKTDKNNSGFVGVNFFKRDQKWRAYIYVARKQIHLGYFESKEEAVIARKIGQKKYHNTEI